MVIRITVRGTLLELHYKDTLKPPTLTKVPSLLALSFSCITITYFTSYFSFSSLEFGSSAHFCGHDMPLPYLPPTLSRLKTKGGNNNSLNPL